MNYIKSCWDYYFGYFGLKVEIEKTDVKLEHPNMEFLEYFSPLCRDILGLISPLTLDRDEFGSYYMLKDVKIRHGMYINRISSDDMDRIMYDRGIKLWEETIRNGRLWYYTQYKDDEKLFIIGYYPNGQIKDLRRYKGGVPNGWWEDWYDNGVKSHETFLYNGKQSGISYSYDKDGACTVRSYYVNGRKDGDQYSYNYNLSYYQDGFCRIEKYSNGVFLGARYPVYREEILGIP